ncbi:methyl-accepting chemotaxis protein [Rhizobium sp.]
MSFLENAKIRTKILSLIVPLCLAGVASSAFLSVQFKKSDTTYSDFIDTDEVAAVEMARANRNLQGVGYRALQTIFYDHKADYFPGIVELYRNNAKQLNGRMEQSKALIPEHTAAINALQKRALEIIALTDKAVALAMEGKDDEAKVPMGEADVLVAPLETDIKNWIDDYTKIVKQRSAEMTDETDSAIFYSLLGMFAAFAAILAASVVVTTRGITTPIARLSERMATLANGETAAEVPGLLRNDELGQMAKAVSVFRDNALAKIAMEKDAEANRSMSERERIEREEAKATEAAEAKLAVDELGAGLSQLADGNVSYRINTPFAARLDGLRVNFNNSVSKLNDSLRIVGQNARAIDAGSNEIRSGADDLSRRTEQQAASVEETAAALEQITTTVKDAARRAEEAGELVSRTRAGAEHSGQVVRNAVDAMQQIEKSSGEIGNIIGVIDEIAFQTNLLALNAGVEAARAGEAGKGFAVVAQEVRELAQRSANAAKEIKALINTSSNQVRSGVALVDETGRSLEEIVTQVAEINRHVASIVESAREQSVGLQEINTAVNTMDQGTQQNAAMVEQSTAASHSLAKEAAALNALLSQFNLGEGGSSYSAPAYVAPARTAAAVASAQPAVAAARAGQRPVVSPARSLGAKLTSAFSGGSKAAAPVQSAAAAAQNWEEF